MPQLQLVIREIASLTAAGKKTNATALRQLIQHWLREQLATALQCTPSALEFALGADGKPGLRSHSLSFNLSHSKTMLALAWSHELTAVGVDIEDCGRRVRHAELAASCFSPAELALWTQSGHCPELWLSLWTRKEALLKCAGLGLTTHLSTVDSCAVDAYGQIKIPQAETMSLRSWELPTQRLSLAWQPAGTVRMTFDIRPPLPAVMANFTSDFTPTMASASS